MGILEADICIVECANIVVQELDRVRLQEAATDLFTAASRCTEDDFRDIRACCWFFRNSDCL